MIKALPSLQRLCGARACQLQAPELTHIFVQAGRLEKSLSFDRDVIAAIRNGVRIYRFSPDSPAVFDNFDTLTELRKDGGCLVATPRVLASEENIVDIVNFLSEVRDCCVEFFTNV